MFPNFVSLLKQNIAEKIEINSGGSIRSKDVKKLLDRLSPILLTAAVNYKYIINAYILLDSQNASGDNLLVLPHYGQIVYSWMAYLGTLPDNEREQLLTPYQICRTIKVNCPVNINVYDSTDSLVASIIADEAVDLGENSLSCYVDENGQKCISLPVDESYRFDIIATGDGTVNCHIAETPVGSVIPEKNINYENITIVKDDVLTGLTSYDDLGSVSNCIILDQTGEALPFSESNANEQEISFTVASYVDDNTPGYVSGGGIFNMGEFCQLNAISEEDTVFSGWYIDDELVSDTEEYRFMVKDNINVEARFISESPSKMVLLMKWLLIIIISLIVVLLIVLCLYMKKKKRNARRAPTNGG